VGEYSGEDSPRIARGVIGKEKESGAGSYEGALGRKCTPPGDARISNGMGCQRRGKEGAVSVGEAHSKGLAVGSD